MRKELPPMSRFRLPMNSVNIFKAALSFLQLQCEWIKTEKELLKYHHSRKSMKGWGVF